MKCSGLIGLLLTGVLTTSGQEPNYDRVFFANSAMSKNYFYSEANYTYPSWVKNVVGKLPVTDSVFFTPGNALQLNYVSRAAGKWEARLLYKTIRGQDYFAPATHLVMHILVASATTVSELPAIGIALEKGTPVFVPMKSFVKEFKTGSWLDVAIPLTRFNIKPSATNKINVVAFRQQSNDNKEHLIYVDDVELAN